MDMAFYLPLIWGVVLSVAVLMYVVLDGFDLGLGILFPFRSEKEDRDAMMSSVAPFWDGNETWLVLGGGGLFAAFPLAFSIIMPAMYLPVLLMLIALIFRGVAFEFRFKADSSRGLWDIAFAAGSICAAFAQGLILGGLVQGIETTDRAFSGGALDWLSPFTLMCGVAVTAGYALLGATWINMKMEGALQIWGRATAAKLLLIVLLFMGLVSLWMPFLHTGIPGLSMDLEEYMQTEIFRRWFGWPNIMFLAPVPVAVVGLTLFMLAALKKEREIAPFFSAIAFFVLGFIGLGVSLWPNVVPPGVTLWQAAASPSSQGFMLVGVAILLPLILAYTAYIYWVFRGKVDPNAYHH